MQVCLSIFVCVFLFVLFFNWRIIAFQNFVVFYWCSHLLWEQCRPRLVFPALRRKTSAVGKHHCTGLLVCRWDESHPGGSDTMWNKHPSGSSRPAWQRSEHGLSGERCVAFFCNPEEWPRICFFIFFLPMAFRWNTKSMKENTAVASLWS